MRIQPRIQRSVVLPALLLCLLFAGWSNTVAQAQTRTHRVVFAVTSGEQEDWTLVMNNMRNLLNSFGDTPYEVEVVAFGPASCSSIPAHRSPPTSRPSRPGTFSSWPVKTPCAAATSPSQTYCPTSIPSPPASSKSSRSRNKAGSTSRAAVKRRVLKVFELLVERRPRLCMDKRRNIVRILR